MFVEFLLQAVEGIDGAPTICRAYSSSSVLTVPVGSWSNFWCSVFSSSQRRLSESERLNNARASVRRSRKRPFPSFFHSSGLHGFASLMKAFLLSIGVIRIRGIFLFSTPFGYRAIVSDHSSCSPRSQANARRTRSNGRFSPQISAPFRFIAGQNTFFMKSDWE